jgi:hypothetical protein
VFISDLVERHVIDERVRWSMLKINPNRGTETALNAIQMVWFALFGPQDIFISDREGAVKSDARAVFCERHGCHRRFAPKARGDSGEAP